MRVDNWPIVLDAEIEKARNKPFEWGQHDCVIWSLNTRARLLGEEPPSLRGRYNSQLSAARRLKENGYDSLLEALCDTIGDPSLDPYQTMKRGDLVLGDVLGIITGTHFASVNQSGGLVWLPVATGSYFWKVG